MATVKGSVKGHHAGSKKGKLREFHVKRAGNGFMVTAHHDAPEGGYGGSSSDPQLFTKHAPLHKHLKGLAAEMHTPEPTSGEMTGQEPMNEQC